MSRLASTPEQRLRELEMALEHAREAQRDAMTVDQRERADTDLDELEEEHAALWQQVHGPADLTDPRSAPEIMREINRDLAAVRADLVSVARSMCLTPLAPIVLPTPTEAAERRHAYRVPSREEIAARAELRGDTLCHREAEAERRSSTDRRRRNDEVIV